MKNHLIEHVAELFKNGVAIVSFNGIDELVGLFEQVLGEAGVGLLGIPRATTRGAQFVGSSNEGVEVCHGLSVARVCARLVALCWFVAFHFG